MTASHFSSIREIVDKILSDVRRNFTGEQAKLLERFVTVYYRATAPEDLAGIDIDNLYGAVVAHWNLIKHRSPGPAKVHLYNPNVEEHGWQSTHTVIEVIADDMPFLVDSVRLAVNRCGLTSHLVIHPVIKVRRNDAGDLVEFADAPGDGVLRESVMHFEIDRQTDSDALERIRSQVEGALHDVRIVVSDGSAMRERLCDIVRELEASPPPIDPAEFAEGIAFLKWLEDNNFIFLGFRAHELVQENGQDLLRIEKDSGLGVLRGAESPPAEGGISRTFASLSPEARSRARKPELLLITRSNTESTVHRQGHMDYVGVKRIDSEGRVVGEWRFLGLYGLAAYTSSALTIPLLRRKVRQVLARAEFSEDSHAGRALLNILETYPRDELFQISEDELLEFSLGMLHLQERQQTRTFIRRDEYGRFFSCIVYIPRDHMSTEVRRTIGDILESHLGGRCVKFAVQMSESILARVHYVIQLDPDSSHDFDIANIEAQIVAATHSWREEYQRALLEQIGEEKGVRLYNRYGEGFRAGYRDYYTPQIAVQDTEKMDSIRSDHDIAMSLYRPLEAEDNVLRFKLFRPTTPVTLSEALPMLENMGLRVIDEHPSKVKLPDDGRIWIHDFGMQHSESELDLDRVKGIFKDAFARIANGDVSNDGFNRLVLRAHLSWREIVVLRAYCKFLRQVRATFSQEYMENALAANPNISRMLVELFRTRFDPSFDADRAAETAALEERIVSALDQVANLDEDRILRSFLGGILATIRTNYYQLDEHGQPKSYVSFKLNPDQIPDMPQPRPKFEISVYSPRVEGVHLRGGGVARGGLRWSDRPEDFRTEILGLVKAQMVKNAVIVPVGSKGGFVPKRLPVDGTRDDILKEGIACYRLFIRGLLDITDNVVGGEIMPPPNVVRHDSDDPYLVVAADKGTATFSDIANEMATSYGFWLGDAFASGGSVGYDHKAMGITARGGWESVKRHFRELGVDTQTTPFSVIGIGDMGGDVFGNGMLLSRTIRLVGAFNHMHIFLDPDPDPETTFQERDRLFKLPRSSWEDYDASLISKGGGVYRRSAKSVPLSPEVREILNIEATSLTPTEVIQALLKAPVDLLWNGGIGTYVKASSEQNADVGDRANDGLRINGRDLRCRVVGEGGNLGFTQLGRVEFARNGGRIYTDAIDNSAGVDCSDHEVNIKILLNGVVDAGDLTVKQRNQLLFDMTDEVSRLVLRNNYRQTLALSLARAQAIGMIEVHGRLMKQMERSGLLDRSIEFLPTDDLLFERKSAAEGLTAPELAVLLAYVKIGLYQEFLASDLPDEDYLNRILVSYFPTPLREPYRPRMSEHRLQREIIATEVVNDLVNRAGTTFMFRVQDETGADPMHVARAYIVARSMFDMPAVWSEIEALDNRVPADVQYAMLLEARALVGRTTRWLVRNRKGPLPIAESIETFTPGAAHVGATLRNHLSPEQCAGVDGLAAGFASAGVPQELASRVASYAHMAAVPDILEVSRLTESDLDLTLGIYFKLGTVLELHWLRDQVAALPRETHWQTMARSALRDDLSELHREITGEVLESGSPDAPGEARLESWLEENRNAVNRCLHVVAEFRSGPAPDFTMLSVAMRDLRALRGSAVPSMPGKKVGAVA